MPKFKDMMRFDPSRLNGPVTTKPRQNFQKGELTEQVKYYVDQQPGIGAGELAHLLYPEMDHNKATTMLSNRLLELAKTGQITRRRQDFKFRYYPSSYRIPGAEVPTIPQSKPVRGERKGRLRAYLEEHPGATFLELKSNLQLSTNYLNVTLWAMEKDGELRQAGDHFYKVGRAVQQATAGLVRREETAKQTTERLTKQLTPVEPVKPVEQPEVHKIKSLNLTTLLKDYAWETGADTGPLKTFLEWCKRHANE